MPHLVILCEGHLEQKVLVSFLRPYWQRRFDTVEVFRYSGNRELAVRFKIEAEQYLTADSQTYILCLLDLYEEPFGLYKPAEMQPEEGFKRVQAHMMVQISPKFHRRFGAFPVVMELETWLLADKVIQKDIGEITHPEAVEHPAIYLQRAFEAKRKTYNKLIDGIKLFGMADSQRVYKDNCPHFIQLIDWLITPPLAVLDVKEEAIKEAQVEWHLKLTQMRARYDELESKYADSTMTHEELEEYVSLWQRINDFVQTHGDIFN